MNLYAYYTLNVLTRASLIKSKKFLFSIYKHKYLIHVNNVVVNRFKGLLMHSGTSSTPPVGSNQRRLL